MLLKPTKGTSYSEVLKNLKNCVKHEGLSLKVREIRATKYKKIEKSLAKFFNENSLKTFKVLEKTSCGLTIFRRPCDVTLFGRKPEGAA